MDGKPVKYRPVFSAIGVNELRKLLQSRQPETEGDRNAG